MLGTVHLARPFVRLRVPSTGAEEHLGRPPPPAQLAWYACSGARSPLLRPGGACGAPLFQRRDVLSREHCWDAGGGVEAAWYVNALAPGAVIQRNEREEDLAQARGAASRSWRWARMRSLRPWRLP